MNTEKILMQENYSVCVPAEIAAIAGIRPGDELQCMANSGYIVIKKALNNSKNFLKCNALRPLLYGKTILSFI